MARVAEGGWRGWLPAAALAGLAILLYARAVGVGLVGDDYDFLDSARRVPLLEFLTGRHGVVGYYRPLSRELYFWWWGRVLGFGALAFHLVNAATYALVATMFYRFLRGWQGPRVALLGTLAWVVFPACGALLSWVSCAQDLIAVFWGVAALALYRAGRHRAAGVACGLAALSKETGVIVPLVLAAFEWLSADRSARRRAELGRLMPAFLGTAAALVLTVAARATWAPGTNIKLWSAAQVLDAWRLPLDFLTAVWPPATVAGVAAAWRQSIPWVIATAMLAALVVPAVARDRRGRRIPSAPPAGRVRGARPAAPDPRAALAFGAALVLIGMIPIAFVSEHWRGYYFSFSALGWSVILGTALDRAAAWPARVVAATAALVSLGSNTVYRPVEASWAPARHPHVNYAFFREMSDFSSDLLRQIAPYCDALRSTPRTFTVGIPSTYALQNVLGPGLRFTCRDTVDRLRPLEEFQPSDADAPFGLLEMIGPDGGFRYESADARIRVRLGLDFLTRRRYATAAACLEAAHADADRFAVYALTIATAAAGREPEARQAWHATAARGATPTPEWLAERLLGHAASGDRAADRARRRDVGLVAAALAHPTESAPHAALGRRLLALGRAGEAAFELSAAYGLAPSGEGLVELAGAYERMGRIAEARGVYTLALTTPLDPATRGRIQRRVRAMTPAPSAEPAPAQ